MKIQINYSCNEDWEEMSSTTKGRYCTACEREVVDLTQMSDEQLIQLLREQSGKRCGRFLHSQVGRQLIPEQVQPTSAWKRLALVVPLAVLGLGGSLWAQSATPSQVIPTFRVEDYPVCPKDRPEGEELPANSTQPAPMLLKGAVKWEDSGKPCANAKLWNEEAGVSITCDKNGHFEAEIPYAAFNQGQLTLTVKCNYAYETLQISYQASDHVRVKMRQQLIMGFF